MPARHSGYGSESEDICTEETPVQPMTLYGLTKVQAERVILEAPHVISLRLATVFGPSPRMRLDLPVNDFVYRAVTDGSLLISEQDFKRNYVHIDSPAVYASVRSISVSSGERPITWNWLRPTCRKPNWP